MVLLQDLPENRTKEQVLNHYEVEKEIADKLKSASRSQRPEIYKNMYNTLFKAVPDHPRLTVRDSIELSELMVHEKFKLIEK